MLKGLSKTLQEIAQAVDGEIELKKKQPAGFTYKQFGCFSRLFYT